MYIKSKIQQNSDHFIIHNSNLYYGGLLRIIILVPFVIGLPTVTANLLGLALPRQHILNCNRIETSQVNCRIQEKTIVQTSEKPSIQLTGAEIIQQEKSGEDGLYTMYQIRLSSKTQKQDFGYAKYNLQDEAELKTIVKQIKLFLADSNQSNLQVRQQDKTWIEIVPFLIFLLLLSFFDILIILIFCTCIWQEFFSPLEKVFDFDKNLHKLTITKLYRFQRSNTIEYSLLENFSIEIGLNCQIYLLFKLKKTQVISLFYAWQAVDEDKLDKFIAPEGGIQVYEEHKPMYESPKLAIKVAEQIRQFLNLNKESEELNLLKFNYKFLIFNSSQHKLTVRKFLCSRKSEFSLLGQVSLQISNFKNNSGATIYELDLILSPGKKVILYSSFCQTTIEEWRDVIADFMNLNIVNI